jgi:hypothetical protein
MAATDRWQFTSCYALSKAENRFMTKTHYRRASVDGLKALGINHAEMHMRRSVWRGEAPSQRHETGK